MVPHDLFHPASARPIVDDYYYSKLLGRYVPTRLDMLLYAHDGRGLGHASRTIAVGLALRRLFPDLRILFISGCADTKMLIGPAALDWIKLPSYRTVLRDGGPEGEDGSAGFYKSVLGRLRAEMLEAMVDILRPAAVLVDHNPAGKRDELLPALRAGERHGTRWFLGVRGVVGEDPGFWSPRTAATVEDHYDGILWYGDRTVLGDELLDRLTGHFGRTPQPVGYVSRLGELKPHLREAAAAGPALAGTVSLPWPGPHTRELASQLAGSLKTIGPGPGDWQIFVAAAEYGAVAALFAALPFCFVKPIGDRYLSSLVRSRTAVVYGGYNSVLDVAAAAIPAIIVLRTTRDREQRDHLDRLVTAAGKSWQIIAEDGLSERSLHRALDTLLQAPAGAAVGIDIGGAETAARWLHERVQAGGPAAPANPTPGT